MVFDVIENIDNEDAELDKVVNDLNFDEKMKKIQITKMTLKIKVDMVNY